MGTTPLSTELATIQANEAATKTNLATVTAGVLALDTLIQNLQNSPGTLGPADQAALDEIASVSAANAATSAAINTAAPGTVVPPPAGRKH